MKKTPLKPGNKPLKSNNSLKPGGLLRQKSSLKHSKLTLKKDCELKKQSTSAQIKWQKAREECIKRFGGKCLICGKPANQVHHIHLRSKRKDLIYNQNNLVLLCDKHHFHSGSERYDEQTLLIASKLGLSVEELLLQAERI